MQSGIEFLRRRIPQVFEGEPFQRQKGRIVDRYTVREKELMDDFTRRIAREQFALGHMQVGAVALPEIFPVLEGQMVPIEDIPKMVHEGKLETLLAEETRAQVRAVPPGIHRRLPQDADAFARTGQRTELPRAGSRLGAGGRLHRGAEGKIRRAAGRRISRRSAPQHPRQSRSLQGTRRRRGARRRPAERRSAEASDRRTAIPSASTASTCLLAHNEEDASPVIFETTPTLRQSLRHHPAQLRFARRVDLRFHGPARAARCCAPTAVS